MNTPSQLSRVAGALLVACVGALVGCSSTTSSAEPPAIVDAESESESGPATESDVVGTAIVGEPVDSAIHATDIDKVMMVGDSITVGAMAALEAQFDALGVDHEIESEKGKRMAMSARGNPSGASVTEDMVDADDHDPAAEVWVVALGTNDIGQYSTPDEIAAAVDEVLAEVPEDAALVWADTYIRHLPEETEEVNAIIRDRVAQRGNSVIAPWSANAPAVGVVSGDGVHPTTDGSVRFATVVTATVRAFLGR